MSENVDSIFLKYKMPPISITATAAAETHIIGPGCPLPNTAYRKPLTTPAIGFSPYQIRHFSGTMELG